MTLDYKNLLKKFKNISDMAERGFFVHRQNNLNYELFTISDFTSNENRYLNFKTLEAMNNYVNNFLQVHDLVAEEWN